MMILYVEINSQRDTLYECRASVLDENANGGTNDSPSQIRNLEPLRVNPVSLPREDRHVQRLLWLS